MSSGEKATVKLTPVSSHQGNIRNLANTIFYQTLILLVRTIFLWWWFCAAHLAGTHDKWLHRAHLAAPVSCHSVPPGHLLVSPAARPVKEHTCKGITAIRRWLPASLRRHCSGAQAPPAHPAKIHGEASPGWGWKGEAASEYRRFSISSAHCCSCESTEILQVPF